MWSVKTYTSLLFHLMFSYKHPADILLLKGSGMSLCLGLMEHCLPNSKARTKNTECITCVHRRRCNKGNLEEWHQPDQQESLMKKIYSFTFLKILTERPMEVFFVVTYFSVVYSKMKNESSRNKPRSLFCEIKTFQTIFF